MRRLTVCNLISLVRPALVGVMVGLCTTAVQLTTPVG
jgi:hypothetical protein